MALLVFVASVSVLVFGIESQPYPQQSSRQSYGAESSGYGGGQAAGGGGGYASSSGSSDGSYQTETKYYYGGKYQGGCTTDGLYYYDDTMFVICSNGYPHEQPCPPGTKTSGSPKYQAGYYYGYTDLCSVNLVDYGYGPEYYAPKGYPVAGDGYAADKKESYGDKGAGYGGYASDKGAYGKDSYAAKNREYGSFDYSGSAKKDAYPKDNRQPYNADTHHQRSAYPQTDIYSAKDSYAPAKSPYGSAIDKKY
jgi:hypothetical protein